MGSISSSIGLVTGLDIGSLIKSYLSVSNNAVSRLTAKASEASNQAAALSVLAAQLASVQYVAQNLTKSTAYSKTSASSSDSSVTAHVSDSPTVGTYTVTPLQSVSTQQLVAEGVASTSSLLGTGTVTFRYGRDLEDSVGLDEINGGEGFERGSIKITDRAGKSTVIDLTTATSIDDVLDAINNQTDVQVSAMCVDDKLKLIDSSGSTTSNLIVSEVNGGTTAASLGLKDINVADTTATGSSIYNLSSDFALDCINDGAGISVNTALADISYTLRDGTAGTIDLSAMISGSSAIDKEATIQDVIDAFNDDSDGKITLSIGTDGKSLIATDNTAGSGTFSLTSINGSDALSDLGLDAASTDGVITGSRVLGGLDTVLLSSLNGGQGIGELGSLSLTDRSGATATVDLSGAETLQNVIDSINAAGLGISASISVAKTGITLTDTTGSTSSNLIVASAASDESLGLDTAASLGITVNDDVTSVSSGDMHLQVVSTNTLLSSYNGGAGVAEGSFTITNSKGVETTITIGDDVETIGDVIDLVNRSTNGIEASLNETGDGILLVDTAGGDGTLTISEGDGSTAEDLHLLGDVTTDEDGSQVLDGTITYSIELSSTDTLASLKATINELAGGITASIINDGSSKPYRLSLTSDMAGTAGKFVIDLSCLDLGLTVASEAKDALLAIGDEDSKIVLVSSDNEFDNAISGVSLTVTEGTGEAVTITVSKSSTTLVTNVSTLVDDYNSFLDYLDEDTAFDTTNNTSSVLTGDHTALRLETSLAKLLCGSFGTGTYKSLADVGITIGDDGTLTFDEDTFTAAFDDDSDAVEKFFSDANNGFAVKLDALIDKLSGDDETDNSLINTRLEALNNVAELYTDRAEALQKRIDARSALLYQQYYYSELVVSKLESNLDVINQLAVINADGSSSYVSGNSSSSSSNNSS
jgi:flagellar hook-associated protein 2